MKKIFLTGSTGYVGTKFIELYGHIYDILGVARSDITSSLDLSDLATVKTRVLDFSPDVIIHTAVALGRDSSVPDDIIEISTTITKNLVDIATTLHIPFIFTSTEAVYGRKNDGNYLETDTLLPRNIYGKSKVLCEEIIQQSNLSYLITRGHRHIGWSKNFHRTKQFPDTITALLS
ncbi:MAG: sugar nucleotide-binding protein [Candidatus Peribacteria bacterium]|jgi:dTDP-4-dehydrorhamnose reductase|nr:sugar nucleotide-binding protein [Candidatus Peribacteria bacterium]